jgi:hypothetical protein
VSDITTYAGDTTTVDYTVMLNGEPVDLTGLTLKWAARRSYGDTEAVIQKETGDGITHTDPQAGKARLTLLPADTASLAVSTTCTLVWALRLYDGSDVYTVATGMLVINPVAER